MAQANFDVDYVQDYNQNFQESNFTYTGIQYQPIPNFTFNFMLKNPGCIVSMKLSLQGIGYVGIIVNNLVIREIPFNNLNFAAVDFNKLEKFTTKNNKITLSLRAGAGIVTLASSKTQPFLNYLQVVSINS